MLRIQNQEKSLFLKISLVLSILFIVCSLPTSFATNVTISEDTEGGIQGALNDETFADGGTVFLNQGNYNKTDEDTNIIFDLISRQESRYPYK